MPCAYETCGCMPCSRLPAALVADVFVAELRARPYEGPQQRGTVRIVDDFHQHSARAQQLLLTPERPVLADHHAQQQRCLDRRPREERPSAHGKVVGCMLLLTAMSRVTGLIRLGWLSTRCCRRGP